MRNIACFQIKVKRDILRKYRTYGELYMGLCKVTGEVPIAIYRTEKRRIFIEEVIHLTVCMFIKYWNFNHCITYLPLQSTVIMWYETHCNIYTDIKYICIIMKNNSSFKMIILGNICPNIYKMIQKWQLMLDLNPRFTSQCLNCLSN